VSDKDGARSSRDSTRNTLIVAIGVSFVCSILVSTAAIVLRPTQQANEAAFQQTIVLQVAGLYDPAESVAAQFEAIETRIVNLETGEFVDMDPAAFDAEDAAKDPGTSVAIPAEDDIAGLKRRAKYARVYLVSDGDQLSQVILPVRGKGLWSTLYGFLAVAPDGNTVRGLKFYEHAETPGLGDQIDRPSWQAQWEGLELTDDKGQPQIEVVRGTAPEGSNYQVDGLSGATLTGRGVENLVRFWTGQQGFGPFLTRLGSEANTNG
jgi:Na+-transporting NADH:ubiquinone oxidoreductase subunit C